MEKITFHFQNRYFKTFLNLSILNSAYEDSILWKNQGIFKMPFSLSKAFYNSLKFSLFPSKKKINTSTVLINKDLHTKILLGKQITWLVIARAPRKMKQSCTAVVLKQCLNGLLQNLLCFWSIFYHPKCLWNNKQEEIAQRLERHLQI